MRPGILLDRHGTIIVDLRQAIMHALAPYIRQSRMAADAISTTVF